MRMSAIGVVSLLLTAAPHAQSVTTINLQPIAEAFGWYAMTGPVEVEADGNPLTQEWLVRQLFGAEARVVRQTDHGLCSSEPFTLDADWSVPPIGRGVTRPMKWTGPTVMFMDLPVPAC